MPDKGPARSRTLFSLFLLFHFLCMGASLGKSTALGSAIREVTGPYERILGAWQSWGMFGPNPPLGTSWLRATGTTPAGEEIPLPVLVGERPADRYEWRYYRLTKVERSMFTKKNDELREGLAHWLCRTQAESGVDLESVQIWKERHMTPDPADHLADPDATRTIKRVDYERVSCR